MKMRNSMVQDACPARISKEKSQVFISSEDSQQADYLPFILRARSTDRATQEPHCLRKQCAFLGKASAANKHMLRHLMRMKPPSRAGAMLSAWYPLTVASEVSPGMTSCSFDNGDPNRVFTAHALAAALAALLPMPLPRGKPYIKIGF